MEIIIEKEEKKIVFKVSGRIDSSTSVDLENTINENLEGYDEVSIDFSDVEYISSAGLRVLLATQKKMKDGTLTVLNPNETVKEIFDITGFADILNIEEVTKEEE